MSLEIENIKNLLQSTATIVKHQEEIKALRGENFNIFSILKMESKENATHSAFLGELLNTKGSHLFGTKFLKHFLSSVGYKGGLNPLTANLRLEKPIGDRNDETKTGGRIDIFIWDEKGFSISIENKIYASDQNLQVARYVNYNKSKNTVYYLTLDGNDASVASKGEGLEQNVHYFCLSYKDTIISWLKLCVKEAAEFPILRESIKQYIILIQKLTNQLTDSKMEKDIHDVIAGNYKAAKLVAANIYGAELRAVSDFLCAIEEKLKTKLKLGWTIKVDENLKESWKGITIWHNNWDGIVIKLQGEPVFIGNKSIFGIVANSKIYDVSEIYSRLSSKNSITEDLRSKSDNWALYKLTSLFSSTEEISQLFLPKEMEKLVSEWTEIIYDLAIDCETPLSGIKRLNIN
jgi:hypothetical protein